MNKVLVSTFLLLSCFAAAAEEIACSGGSDNYVYDYDSREGIDSPTAADVRVNSDEFVRLYVSPQYPETNAFWERRRDFRGNHAKPFGVTKEIGSDTEHLETLYRKSYVVSKAYGKAGYFVVVEYGIKTTEFDVIHSQVWKPTDAGWRVIAISNRYRCPPNSSLVKL